MDCPLGVQSNLSFLCFQLRYSYLIFQVLIFSALVAATYAAPIAPPRPFAYQYGVKDGHSGPSFDSSESQNAEGKKTH